MHLVGLGHGRFCPQALPDRRIRRGVGLRCPVSDADDARRAAADARPARGLRRVAPDRARRGPVAHAADQFPAVGRGLPADPALARGRRLRSDGARPAHVAALDQDRADDPTAAILDSRTVQSTPERGSRAGYDGHKRKKGSKIHLAVDTLGHLLALRVTPANAQDRAQVAALAEAVQDATGSTVDLAFVDQGYTGEQPAVDAAIHGIRLEVVKLEEAKRGFVLLPRRWVVERSFAWAARFRRLAKDYERLPETV